MQPPTTLGGGHHEGRPSNNNPSMRRTKYHIVQPPSECDNDCNNGSQTFEMDCDNVSQTFEIESSPLIESDNQEEESATQGVSRTPRSVSPLWARNRFVLLSVLVCLLTLSCPGTSLHLPAGSSGQHFRQRWSMPLLIQGILVYSFTMGLFFLLHQSDPGYLTSENLNDFDEDCQKLLLEQMDQGGEGHSKEFANGIENEPLPGGHQGFRRRFCSHCQIAPPLRSHHCKDCGKCVATFDHHCHFIGTCIGERNHCRFWWYLLAQAMGFSLACHIVGSSPWGLSTLMSRLISTGSGLDDNSMISNWIILHVVTAKVVIYPLRLLAWIMVWIHTWMAVSNSTTFETSKGPGRHIDYLKGVGVCDFPFSKVGSLAFSHTRLSCNFFLTHHCCAHHTAPTT